MGRRASAPAASGAAPAALASVPSGAKLEGEGGDHLQEEQQEPAEQLPRAEAASGGGGGGGAARASMPDMGGLGPRARRCKK